MMNVTTAANAANAYARTQSLSDPGVDDAAQAGGGSDFGSVLENAVGSVLDDAHTADSLSAQGLNGGGDLTSIITAVSKAQLALQTTTTIRDRVVQAYQDIMKMTI